MAEPNLETTQIQPTYNSTEEFKEALENGQADNPQFQEAKEKGLTWEFEGKEYPLFMANSTGNIGIPIVVGEKKVGIVIANFDWSGKSPKSEPFLQHLDLDIREVTDTKEDLSERQRKNLTTQNAILFRAIVQNGIFIDLDEFGNQSEPKEKTYQEMCILPPELQSDMIDRWLGEFHIERHFNEGVTSLEALFGEMESIMFKVKIGNFQNPAHVLFFEFDVPSKKARDTFKDKRVRRRQRFEGKQQIEFITVDYPLKLKFAKSHLRSVGGVCVVENGIETPVKNDEQLKLFRDNFNPEWFMSLADALHDTFSMAGK